MANYQTPGSYIEESSSTNKNVTGVSGGIAAFVGVAEKGPVGEAVLCTNFGEFVNTFGTFISNGWLAYAVENYFVEAGKGAKVYVTRTVHYTDITDATTKTSVASTKTLLDASSGSTLKITATSDGTWGDKIKYTVSNATSGVSTEFKVSIFYDTETVAREEFDNYDINTIDSVEGVYVKFTSLLTTRPVNVGTKTALASGNDGLTSITDTDYIGDEGSATGLYSFDIVDENLNIAIPGVATNAVHIAGANYAEGRKSCFFIAEVPQGLSYTDARDYKKAAGSYSSGTALTSKYCAIYYPWYYAKDSVTGGKKLVPPSAAMAGVYARTASSRGVYKAPAGVEDGKLKSAIGIEKVITDVQQTELNPIGVNVIRVFSDSGIVAWGARTCDTSSDWRYINVRLLFNYIGSSVRKSTKWAVFEPNDDILWSKIELQSSGFMNDLFKNGAFADTKDPTKAFYVLCDETNNTSSTIAAGQVVNEIGIAPSKPGEFIIIKINQWDGGSSVTTA